MIDPEGLFVEALGAIAADGQELSSTHSGAFTVALNAFVDWLHGFGRRRLLPAGEGRRDERELFPHLGNRTTWVLCQWLARPGRDEPKTRGMHILVAAPGADNQISFPAFGWSGVLSMGGISLTPHGQD